MAKKDKAVETEVKKTSIAPDRSKYTASRSASGKKSLSNGDIVAQALEGFDTDTTMKIAAEVTGVALSELQSKYSHLNAGQQRMNAGNRVRGAVKRLNAEKEGSGDKALDRAVKPHRAALKEAQKLAARADKAA